MTLVKIKVKSMLNSVNDIKSVENKLLLGGENHRLIMFTDVKVVTEEETYGRKNNKTRNVRYMYCKLHGWNNDGDFTGHYSEELVSFYLRNYSILRLRRNYLDFKKQLDAMLAVEEKYNEPDFVKAIPV